MSTLREAAIGAMGALETARNGLAWYRDRYPESTDGSDDEAAGDIDAAIDALRAELAKPDARPAPAEPQPIDAWSIVRMAESAGVMGLRGRLAGDGAEFINHTGNAVVTAVRAALSQPAAQQKQAGERKPLTDEPIEAAEWERECDDTDTILRALGLDPARCRTDGGSLKVQMIVGALAKPAAAPEGWQLVPVEPTEAMWSAGRDPVMFRDLKHYRPASLPVPAWQRNPDGTVEKDTSKGTTAVHVWRAMLAAAPRPAPAEPQSCSLGCTTECKAKMHGCASECPALPWQPPAPAEPQPTEAEKDAAFLGRLRDRSESWQAYSATAPQPAGGEPQPAAQQEPLFWYRPRSDGLYEGPIHNAQIERARKESGGWVPLYTQAGERKPLTEAQINDFVRRATGIAGGRSLIGEQVTAFTRIVEAAHGITATKGER